MYHVKPEILQKVKKVSEVVQHIPISRCKHFGQWFTHMLSSYDYRDVTITPATTTFEREMTIQGDPHELVLYEMQSSHTDGDTLIYLPKEEILFSGDILFIQGTPVLWAGTADNWIDALKRIIELNPKTIVPGHGYFTDTEGVKALIDYWQFVDHELKQQFLKGVTSVEAANLVALSADFKKRGYHKWDAAERIVTSSMTLYKHWSNAPPSKPSTYKQLKMFSEQAELSVRLKAAS